jgi:signal transduction histidine kinase
MGRLFWKFFFCFWLAQMLTGLGVGVAIWLNHDNQGRDQRIDSSPPASMMVTAAAATLEHGGLASLQQWLEKSTDDRHAPFRLLAVDGNGHDVLGRTVPGELLRDAETRLSQGDTSVQRKSTADGQSYLLFVQHKHDGAEEVLRPLTGELRPSPHFDDGRRPPMPPGPRGEAPDNVNGGPADGGNRRLDFGPGPRGPDFAGPGGSGGPGAPRPDEPRDRHRFDLRQLPPVLPLLGGAIASFLSAWLLAWYFAKPIRSLRTAFAAAAEGNLSLRVGPGMASRKDELAALGEDFDHMAARLQTLVDSQRRLLHDVSHELRSPLARLQAAIGLLRQQPERTPEFVERIERESQRMDKLVGELLTLARLDAGMAGKLTEEFDLDELLADLLGDAGFEAETKGCAVSYAEPSARPTPLLLRGNPDLLHRALDNILRNAIRHSPSGSEVRLDAECTDHRLTLRISDRGPGVPAADLERIFEPFVRGEAAPTGNGYGLGLAIARRVVTAHGGTISAHNREGGGLEMRIELPLAPH